MSYSDGEAAILTRIQAHDDYDTYNTSRSNWKILNSGRNSFYAILRPHGDPAPLEFITPTVYMVVWRTVVEVWQRYTDDVTTQSNLYSAVSKIITQMQAYKNLDTDDLCIANAEISEITAPLEMWVADGVGPAWLKQELTITWHEQSSAVTFV